MQNTATDFFEKIISDYDSIIKKVVSPFPKMLWAMFYYLPKNFKPKTILELGCGTGNLTMSLSELWPESHIVVVDASRSMLDKTQQNMSHKNLELLEASFEDLNFKSNSFDLVTSSLALHHLQPREYKQIIYHIYGWLKSGGFFAFNDCVRSESRRLYEANHNYWIQLAKKHGISDEEMVEQIEHHKVHDHYPNILNLIHWMQLAGFRNVDMPWRYCIWAVLQGEK